jgi:hypothetical protein
MIATADTQLPAPARTLPQAARPPHHLLIALFLAVSLSLASAELITIDAPANAARGLDYQISVSCSACHPLCWTVVWGDGTISADCQGGPSYSPRHTYTGTVGSSYGLLVSYNESGHTYTDARLLLLGPDNLEIVTECPENCRVSVGPLPSVTDPRSPIFRPDGLWYLSSTEALVRRYDTGSLQELTARDVSACGDGPNSYDFLPANLA